MSLTNRAICNALFVATDGDDFVCNTCTKAVRSSNGYSNLLTHLRIHHPGYVELARVALRDDNACLRLVDKRSVDLYRWVEWIVMERLPFCVSERSLDRANSKMSTVSRGTIKLYMNGIKDCVEVRIKNELPDLFGLVLDGWVDGHRHYLAVFAVFSDSRSRDGLNSVSARDADYNEDLDCDK